MAIVLIKKGVKGTGSLIPPTSSRPSTPLSPIINNPSVKIISPTVPLISRDEMTEKLSESIKEVVVSGAKIVPKVPFPAKVEDFDPGPAPAYSDTWTFNSKYPYGIIVGGAESVDDALAYSFDTTMRWTHPALFDQGNVTTEVFTADGSMQYASQSSGLPDVGLLTNGVLASTGKTVACIRLTGGSVAAYYGKVFKVVFKQQGTGKVLVTAYFKHPAR